MVSEVKKSNSQKHLIVKYPIFFGLAYRYKKPNGTWAFGVNYRMIFILIVGISMFLWFVLTLFLYLFFKYYKDYDNMTFVQAVSYPIDREGHTTRVGDYHIDKAKEAMKAGKGIEAYMHVAAGVQRSTKNLEGKLILSQFYIYWGKQEAAILLLESGIPFAYNNLEYIRTYIRLVLNMMEDDKLIKVARQFLADDRTSKDVKDYLAMAVATVYAYHGDYNKSKEYIEKYGLDKSMVGILRLSKNEWEQGNKDEAIEIIAKSTQYMSNMEPVYALLVNYYLSMKDYNKARQYASLRVMDKPFDIMPRIDYLRVLVRSGERSNAITEMEKLFDENKYADSEMPLLYIANFATELGDIDLMRRIYEQARKNKFSVAPFCLLLFESFINGKEYISAIKFSEEILKDKPAWLKRYEDAFTCLRAMAYYGSGDIGMATVLVDELLKRNTASPKTLISAANRLMGFGADQLSHKILMVAVERSPKHQMALSKLVQSEIKMGDSTGLDKHILRLLNMRRPSRELIKLVEDNLVLDRFIFMGDREKVLARISAIYDLEKVSGIRMLSDMPLAEGEENVTESNSAQIE